MKIREVFEATGNGGVHAKLSVTIVANGSSAKVSAGTPINATSALAGVTGQWILDHLESDVPPDWKLWK